MSYPIATPVYTFTTGARSWAGNVLDDFGCAWVVESEEGWSSTAPVKGVVEDKTHGDGAWAAPGTFGARVITLTGTCVAPDQVAMLQAKDRIKAALSPRALSELVVEELHLTRRASVRLTDKIDPKDKGTLAFTFALTVTAADPRRYGAPQTAYTELLNYGPSTGRNFPGTFPWHYQVGEVPPRGGSIIWENTGTYDLTPARFVIHGPVYAPGIYHIQSGRSLTFEDLTVEWDSFLEVDLGQGTALLNGVASRAGTLSADSAWFLMVPGPNEIVFRGLVGPAPPPGIDPIPEARLNLIAAPAWE